jgi:hypothetical protein
MSSKCYGLQRIGVIWHLPMFVQRLEASTKMSRMVWMMQMSCSTGATKITRSSTYSDTLWWIEGDHKEVRSPSMSAKENMVVSASTVSTKRRGGLPDRGHDHGICTIADDHLG